jgi:glycosyltransferase involved in cell wall biosynthesis
MISIAHLIDDTAVGGINRALKDQTAFLRGSFSIAEIVLNPRRPLAPNISDDIAIIHFTSSWSKLPFLTLLRAQRTRQPIVIVEHTYTRAFEEHCVPDPGRFRMMLRLCYCLADRVVAVSHGQAQWMLASNLVPSEKLSVIQQSVDYSKLLSLDLPVRTPGMPLRLAAYGRYSQQKGFDVLIEAMRLLPPGLATLTLAGYGEDKAALEINAQNMPNIIVGSSISDLPEFLSDKDVVVMPSRWEAFGIVCLEARAAGRPLLISKVDGLVEQVDSTMGDFFAPDDPQLLAEAIQRAAKWDLTKMGANARASVGSHNDKYHREYRRLWTELSDERKEARSRRAA